MATVRIAVFLATFHIALGILNPCEYDYLPYFRSRTFFIRILFIFIEPLPHMFIICKCIFQMHTLWYFIIIQNDTYTKDFV